MADNWRGWSDAKVWESPEHDLSITARSTHQGHNQLALTVRDGPVYTWRTSLDVEIDGGEETSAIARALAECWPTTQP